MTHWSNDLARLDACDEALEWAQTQESYAAAWASCTRGDWMLWLVGRMSGPSGCDRRKRLVLCACDCAELSAHLATDDDMVAVALCFTIARDWASGGVSDLEDVSAAATVDVAYAAATVDAAYAYAADAADAATCGALAECTDIVREHYPTPPDLKDGGE